MPWYDIKDEKGGRHGKFGQIVPQDEFLALMRLCDAFDLVKLSEEFVAAVRPKIEENFKELAPLFEKLEGADLSDNEESFEDLVHEGKVVGYVKKSSRC